jgi:hypothetical protein
MKFTDKKAFSTNWTNGMKLGSEHFQHLESSIEESLEEASALALLGSTGYGLLPNTPFSLRNSEGQSGRTVRVTLEACQAMLPCGARVEIVPRTISAEQIPKQAPYVEFIHEANTRYHIYLTIGQDGRIGAGVPQTRPIREPYLSHDYQLECIAQDKLSAISAPAGNRMKVGEWKSGKLLEGYIPPCMQLGGFQALEKWFLFFRNHLENTVKLSTHIINEQRRKDPAKADFCEPIVQYIRGTHGYYRWILPEKSPAFFIAYFGDLAGVVKGNLEIQDRDFVRNILKNGDVNNLNQHLSSLLALNEIPLEDMAGVMVRMRRFMDSLLSTLQMLVSHTPPAPRSGERNIVAG